MRAWGVLIAVALAVVGCGEETWSGDHLRVVATTTQVADLVRNVGRDRLEVRQILSGRADPHEYEPRPSDERAIATAKVVFQSGGEVDEWLGRLVDNAGGKASVVKLIDSVHTIEVERREVDPHWWQDPRNAILAVEAIRRALVEVDPAGRRAYERNARSYVHELRTLDRQIATCMAKVPEDKRKLVTTHEALRYFDERYGIQQVGTVLPSLSTEAQPSARDIQRLVDRVRGEGVEAIFPERRLGTKLERAVAREAGVVVGKPVWADALGGATYRQALAANAAAIVAGMTGGARTCRPRV